LGQADHAGNLVCLGLVAMLAAVGPFVCRICGGARRATSIRMRGSTRFGSSTSISTSTWFEKKERLGGAELGLDWKKPDAKRLILDTRDLTIDTRQRAAGNGGVVERIEVRSRSATPSSDRS
jgi:hypothetical protein